MIITHLIWQIIVTTAITWIIIAWFWLTISKYFWILDDPRRAKVYNRPRIPTNQWVVLFLAFLSCIVTTIVATSWGTPMNHWTLNMLLGAGTLVLIATIEVYVKISAVIRLLVQFLIVGLVIWYGWLDTELIQIAWYKIEFSRIFGTLFSFIWFILCINAINRFDGIEWQTSGVASIWYLTIWAMITWIIIPYFPDMSATNKVILATVQYISIILFILSLIYAILESSKKCLLRDAWTYFYWFTMAYLSLLWWAKVWTLVVVFSLVIFDAIRVILYRILIMKKNPLKWDLSHIHHRLLTLGRSRWEVRTFVRVWSASMSILMLVQWSNSLNKLIIFAMMALIFFGVNAYLYLRKKLDPVYKLNPKVTEILNDPIYKQ